MTDRLALQLAVEHYRERSTVNAKHIDSKLADEPWTEVAEFASYSCQCESLNLTPWEIPPCWILDPDNPDEGHSKAQASKDGRVQAAQLLREMLSLGISKWHPDPRAAIEEARRRRAS